jgi:signal transduction histidine kinase
VDLHACLREALKLSDLSFQSKRVTLVTQLEATSFHVRGDERRLKRALATLARNAVTVTPPNGKVTVTTASRGREIEIAFEDDGPPLDGEALRKLFLPFEEGRRASQFGLSELGLSRYICKAIIEAHGGEVKATARSNRRGGIICVKLKTLAK